jgi:hypothetical protein
MTKRRAKGKSPKGRWPKITKEDFEKVIGRIQELDLTPEEKIMETEETLQVMERKRREGISWKLLRRSRAEEGRISEELLASLEDKGAAAGRVAAAQHYPDMEAALDMVWLSDFDASEEERIREELLEPDREVATECLARINKDGTLREAADGTDKHLSSMIFEARLGEGTKRKERLKHAHAAALAQKLADGPVRVMEDSGATKNFISLETVHKRGLGTFQTSEAKGLAVQLADKSVVRCTKMTRVSLLFSPDYRYATDCYVLPMGTDVDIILGQPWIHSLGPHYKDPQKGIIRFRKRRSQQTIQLKTVCERHQGCKRAEVINAAMAMRACVREGKRVVPDT